MMKMRMTTINPDYYCSQKFWWLSVDIEKLTTQSCCSASPHKINIDWIENYPGKLFNTPKLQSERKFMLDNIPVETCQSNCWTPERHGLQSRRLIMQSNVKTHTNIESDPTHLNIIIGSNCNMTCVYCCKQYSSAWFKDIADNGTYPINETNNDRYKINNKDRVVASVSQKEINVSPNKTKLINELGHLCSDSNISNIDITGGEPFLYLYLEDLISKLPKTVQISVYTGLGVDEKRFSIELKKLQKYQNINIVVSCENIGKPYEMVRAGNSWQRFENNLLEIQKHKIKYSFNSTLTNLTLFGLVDFVKYVGNADMRFGLCNDPKFLSIHIMDDNSKDIIYNSINQLPLAAQNIIKNSLDIIPDTYERADLKNYLIEFAKRRELTLDIFPKTFIEWLNNVV